MAHSSFEKIPVSRETQEKFIRGEITQIEMALKTAKTDGGKNRTVLQLETAKNYRNIKLYNASHLYCA